MNTKQSFSVTLTLQCGARQYVRTFNVEAANEADAVAVATMWGVPNIPRTDPLHTDGVEGVDAGAYIEVVGHEVA